MNYAQRLEQLRQRREEANAKNLEATAAEAEKMKSEVGMDVMRRREQQQQRAKETLDQLKEAEAGRDYYREKCVKMSEEEVSGWMGREKIKKKRGDTAFSDYAQMTHRKFKSMEAELETMARDRRAHGEAQEGVSPGTVQVAGLELFGHRPAEKAVDAMVEDLDAQLKKRRNYSKSRQYDDDIDVTYVNERNFRFNMKVGRFYDKHTAAMRESLEKGPMEFD